MRTLLILIILLAVFSLPGAANTLDFRETYRDYDGYVRVMTAENLIKYPLYSITILDNGYTLSRLGETVTLPKRTWIDYNFYPDRIRPVITIQNQAQINNLVTKVSPSEWYLTFPWSASKIRSVTDNLIDMGVFQRSVNLNVRDSNTTCGEECKAYLITPQIINGDIRLYFNPQEYSGVVWPLTITENTITVTNATTSGWTTNTSLNGSRWTGDGTLALNLNSSYFTNLVGYWSADETTGTVLHNVNTESGSINTTNQCTFTGNTTITSNQTGHIGVASKLDGTDDYLTCGNHASTRFTTGEITLSTWFYHLDDSEDTIFSIGNSAENDYGSFRLTVANTGAYFKYWNATVFTSTYAATYGFSNNTWYKIDLTYTYGTGSTMQIYVNGAPISGSWTIGTGNNIATATTAPLKIGVNSGFGNPSRYWNGSLDEIAIWRRALSASEIAILYNASMRATAMPIIMNQTASTGNIINRTRMVYSGQDSTNNISLYARVNNTTAWALVQANITSTAWYNIPAAIQNNSLDFGAMLSGTGANTVFFTSLEWDETAATVNNVAFNFTNMTISETQIYQSSQATKITVDVNDSDGTITAVTFNFTLLGTPYTLAMANEGGDTWGYSFISSVTGVYNITSFNATDNSSGTNGTLWGHGFTVVPVGSGGESGSNPVVPKITPTETFHPIDPVGMAKDETGQQILYGGMLVGLFMVGWSTDKRKEHKDLGLIGLLVIVVCAYGLGVIVI